MTDPEGTDCPLETVGATPVGTLVGCVWPVGTVLGTLSGWELGPVGTVVAPEGGYVVPPLVGTLPGKSVDLPVVIGRSVLLPGRTVGEYVG